ncbi:MAG TPA: RES family NAD+ phosphorylase [Geminicoccaceae bacterium]|nr:RES family NAD+ phosphorylase [Geminicoccus sp.]HMU49506.1 RES family NAD+ phosphorylase [Geminicoccaceae bacterium]
MPGCLHDRSLLDALEAMAPTPFVGAVWRVTRKGREPLRGSTAAGRWSPAGEIEVLYTSLERDGALAEIGFRLSLEPVWPSRIEHEIHRVQASADRMLRFAEVASLRPLGVDVDRYETFDYTATRAIASAAHFLEFDGLVVPSARAPCANLVAFMDRVVLTLTHSEAVDWQAWRSRRR